MNIPGRVPKNSTTPFVPSFQSGVEYINNLTATCNTSTGVVTISCDEFDPPFNSNTSSVFLRATIVASFTTGSNSNISAITAFSPYSVITYDTESNTFTGSNTSITNNPYESGSGFVLVIPDRGFQSKGTQIYDKISNVGDLSFDINVSQLNSINSNESWRDDAPITSGNARIYVQAAIAYGQNKVRPFYPTVRYHSEWQYTDVNISGPNINAPVGPQLVTNFQLSGRTISWDDSTTNAAYFIALYKWDGSTWQQVRFGYLADNYEGFFGTGDQSYTIPDEDGAGTFYIAVSTASTINFGTFSAYASSSSYTLS